MVLSRSLSAYPHLRIHSWTTPFHKWTKVPLEALALLLFVLMSLALQLEILDCVLCTCSNTFQPFRINFVVLFCLHLCGGSYTSSSVKTVFLFNLYTFPHWPPIRWAFLLLVFCICYSFCLENYCWPDQLLILYVIHCLLWISYCGIFLKIQSDSSCLLTRISLSTHI